MVIHRQPSPRPCPVQILSSYLALRGNSPGPIFRTNAGTAVPRNMFISHLKFAISTLLFINRTVSELALHHLPQSRDCPMPRLVFLAVGKRMPFRNTLESPHLRQHELLFHYWHFFLANNAGLLARERYTWAGWRDLARADFAVFAIFLPQL